jgi:ADP-ribose pyrophosphatase
VIGPESSTPADPGDLPIADQPADYPLTSSEVVFTGRVWDIVAEDVTLTDGVSVRREFMKHPGAAAVIAIDAADQVLLQRQYRHPVRALLWEPPAGLLDLPGELPAAAAQRELREEADLEAGDWRHLISYNSTPGGTSEVISIFLARDLQLVAATERYQRYDEEADLLARWVRLDQAVDLVLTGALHSPTAVLGILAAAETKRRVGGWDALPEVSLVECDRPVT